MNVEKTVFISYRRANKYLAILIFQSLKEYGFDVFIDTTNLASGDYEQAILENIRARAHFIVVLMPSALERCSEPDDWLRREIEEAMDYKRNIVPIMAEEFDFKSSSVANVLVGKLAALRAYNGLVLSAHYFDAAMTKLRNEFLNIPLKTVLHPVSKEAAETAWSNTVAANANLKISAKELEEEGLLDTNSLATDIEKNLLAEYEAENRKAQSRGCYSTGIKFMKDGNHPKVAAMFFDMAVKLDPEFADAYKSRGDAYEQSGEEEQALNSYKIAVQLEPDNDEFAEALHSAQSRSLSKLIEDDDWL